MLKFIKSTKTKNEFPKDYSDVVFIGRSNVGKSSLLNAIYNQKIAYVGKKPGMTKMINFFEVDETYYAVDVPGYGFANRSDKEIIAFGRMMDDYFNEEGRIKLVVMIVDIRHKPSKDDVEMMEYLRHHHLKVLVVANKADKVSNNEKSKSLKEIAETLGINKDYIISVSALKKEGVDKIKSYIETCL